MNYFVLAFVSAIAIGTISIKADFENPKIKAAYEKCLSSHPLAPEDVEHFKKKDIVPSSPNAKCLMACLLKEGKLLKDGQYSLENALVLADVMNVDKPDFAVKAREIAEKCAKEVGTNAGPDECEFAYKMGVCVHADAMKMNLETPNF